MGVCACKCGCECGRIHRHWAGGEMATKVKVGKFDFCITCDDRDTHLPIQLVLRDNQLLTLQKLPDSSKEIQTTCIASGILFLNERSNTRCVSAVNKWQPSRTNFVNDKVRKARNGSDQ